MSEEVQEQVAISSSDSEDDVKDQADGVPKSVSNESKEPKRLTLEEALLKMPIPRTIAKNKRLTSELWNFFSVITPSSYDGAKTAVCHTCFDLDGTISVYKGKFQSNMIGHLKNIHKPEYKEYQELMKASSHGTSTPMEAARAKRLLHEVRKAEVDGDEKRFKEAKGLYKHFQPVQRLTTGNVKSRMDYRVGWTQVLGEDTLNTESDVFRWMLNGLNESYVPPSRLTMSTKYEPEILQYVLHFVRQSLNRARVYFTKDGVVLGFISVQFDGWTNSLNINFLGISITYFDPLFNKLIFIVLAVYRVPRGKADKNFNKTQTSSRYFTQFYGSLIV